MKTNLKNLSLEKLLELWNEVSKKKTTVEVAEVRGWILEAIEDKNPEGFNEYLDGFYEDEDLRRFVSK